MIRFGIMGAGIIANVMASTLEKISKAQAYAVGSRNIEKAEDFRRKHSMIKAYGSYEELVRDEKVDIVYICTPHSFHYENAKLCLEHGKNVLCEKPFTVNKAQARELIQLAEDKGLFLCEAMWTRFMPLADKLKKLTDSRIVGEAMSMTANLNSAMMHIDRLVNPNLAGGALLDIGIYPLTIASIVMGDDIEKIKAAAVLTEEGVDKTGQYTIFYKNGKMADLNSGICSLSDGNAVIYCTEGFIVVEAVNRLNGIRVMNRDFSEIAYYPRGEQISGYEFEVYACIEALENNKKECNKMSHAQTLTMMEQMDEIRRQMKVRYPFE